MLSVRAAKINVWLTIAELFVDFGTTSTPRSHQICLWLRSSISYQQILLGFTPGAFPSAVSLLCALLRIEFCPVPAARGVIHILLSFYLCSPT